MTQRTVIAVTGGLGYVGKFIVRALEEAGFDVVIGARASAQWEGGNAVRAFLLAPDSDYDQFLGGCDGLVHAAFDHIPGRYRGGEGDDPAAFWSKNVDESLRLFETAKRKGVGRVVFLSSRAVYGTQAPGVALVETGAAEPDTLYGEAKLAVETALIGLGNKDFKPVSFRVTGVYGAARQAGAHKWLALFEDYISGAPISPRAATEVHGGDVAAAVVWALQAPAPRYALYNVSDVVLDRRQVLAPLKARAGSPQPLPVAGDAADLNIMNCDRLRAEGWTPGGAALFHQEIEMLVASYMNSYANHLPSDK